MNHLKIDFESRSKIDLKKAGIWRYAEDESTEIICCAVKLNDAEPKIWIAPAFLNSIAALDLNILLSHELRDIINKADIIEAHNAEFERAMWRNIMVKRHGFDSIPLEKFRCSAAKAAAKALPRSLEGAGEALGLPIQKDKAGHALMLKMCKPRKAVKADKDGIFYNENEILWHETPEDIIRLCKYCIQDVEAEHALSEALPDLNEFEQNLWFLDQRINEKGIHIDQDSIHQIIEMVKQEEEKLIKEFKRITGLDSPRQRDATLKWLILNQIHLENLQKETLESILESDELSATVRRVLEIRLQVSKVSTSKYNAMMNMVCKDGRVRGTMLYHAASTGRWGGKGIQPHNMPRKCIDVDEVKAYMDSPDMLKFFYGEPFSVASKCVRSVICAHEGYELICSDFKAIEACDASWLAGATDDIYNFNNKISIYKLAAANIFGVDPDEIDDEQRTVGKVARLQLQYGGGIAAFATMAVNYGIDLDSIYPLVYWRAGEWMLKNAKKMAKIYLKTNDDMLFNTAVGCDIVKQLWRKDNPEIVNIWERYETAAKRTVMYKDTMAVGDITFYMENNFLIIELPSGRKLSYYDPTMAMKKTPWGENKSTIRYMGVDSKTYKWVKQFTYGGKIFENVCQAVARDLLAEALIRVHEYGYETTMHVHDEIVVEIPKGDSELSFFNNILKMVPTWAKGCPIDAEGWVGKRYRK